MRTPLDKGARFKMRVGHEIANKARQHSEIQNKTEAALTDTVDARTPTCGWCAGPCRLDGPHYRRGPFWFCSPECLTLWSDVTP